MTEWHNEARDDNHNKVHQRPNGTWYLTKYGSEGAIPLEGVTTFQGAKKQAEEIIRSGELTKS